MAGVTSQYVAEQRDLGIGGLNVQSLLADRRNKMEEVKDLIYRHKIDIFVLGESWLPGGSRTRGELTEKLHIDDFTYERADRRIGDIGGGLIVYLRQNVRYALKSKWDGPHNVQFLTVAITRPTKFDLVAIYNPQSSYADIVTAKMRHILEVNQCQGIPVMFIGDLNIDPGRPGDVRAGRELIDLEREFSTRRLIFANTRKQYCIDHIITNIPERRMVPIGTNVIPTSETHTGDRYISDHNLILCRVKHDDAAAPEEKSPNACSSDDNTCKICNKSFKNKHGLNIHMAKMHKSEKNAQAEKKSLYWCPKCPYTAFRTSKELDHHVENSHSKCEQCGQICLNERGLAIHRGLRHKEDSNQATPKGQTEGNGNVSKLEDEQHACSKCPDKKFISQRKLSEHVDVNHKRCTICSEICLNERGLSIHMGQMHKDCTTPSGSTCSLCGQLFKNEAGLRIHMGKMHKESSTQTTREKQLTSDALRRDETYYPTSSTQITTYSGSTCSLCGQLCKNEAGLRIHMGKMHKESSTQTTREKQLTPDALRRDETYYSTSSTQRTTPSGSTCSLCGQVCKNEAGLRIHMGKMHKESGTQTTREKQLTSDALRRDETHYPSSSTQITTTSSSEYNEQEADAILRFFVQVSSPDSNKASGNFRCTCPICGQVCKNETEVFPHIEKMHGSKESKRQNATGGSENDFNRMPPQSFSDYQTSPFGTQGWETAGPSCPYCAQVCKNDHGLSIHIGKMHGGKESERQDATGGSQNYFNWTPSQLFSDYQTSPFGTQGWETAGPSCPYCGQVCKNDHGLSIHIGRMHKVSNNSYSYSDYNFGVQSTYHTPSLMSAGGSSGSSCPICGQVCKNEHGVSVHMGRMHK